MSATDTHRQLALVLATNYLQHGAPDRARDLMRGCLELWRDDRDMLRVLAAAAFDAGAPSEALTAIEALGPQSPGAVIQIVKARALLGEGRVREARAVFAAFSDARRMLVMPR